MGAIFAEELSNNQASKRYHIGLHKEILYFSLIYQLYAELITEIIIVLDNMEHCS